MPRPKTVVVIVYSARKLNSRRGSGIPLSSVVFGFGKDKFQTSQFRDRNPTWNAEHSFTINDPKIPLKLTIKDKDDPIGQCQIPLTELPCDEHTAKWLPVGPHRKFPNPSGEVCLDCWIEEYYDDNCQIRKTNYSKIKQKLAAVKSNKLAKEKQPRDSVGIGGQSMRGSLSMEDLSFEKTIPNGTSNGSLFPIEEPKGSSDISRTQLAKSMLDLSHKRRNSLSETVSGESTTPSIKIIVPTMGSEHGGTLVMVTGRNLGQSREDIIGLSIAGCDCLSTLEYYSSAKIMCTTLEGSGSGYISLTTLSGGTGVSNVKYHFNSVLDNNEANDIIAPVQSETDKVKKFIQRRKSLSDYHLTKELTQLKGQVFDLKTENKELRQYIDRLLVYLMEQYPEALESTRLYR